MNRKKAVIANHFLCIILNETESITSHLVIKNCDYLQRWRFAILDVITVTNNRLNTSK
ncbi:hypothetical protein FQV37_2007 [Psychrobacter nivimaris]|uniref:Uncharacterized protein n=1 Tax=Psychrobacter nivimaris TaxID=281738 RepID=A0A6N7C3L8_9GAMM|nr:hypothetical protein FQV37_2007 [Psychrobacter nivimaris]